MDDLISRQAAIDALNGEINITGRANAEAVRGYVRLVKDRLERLPSAQPEIRYYGQFEIKDPILISEWHWIPVSERLPEENQICIVTDETMRNTYEYRFCKETYDENQGWTYLKHRIIAWMPLPDPYKEEE